MSDNIPPFEIQTEIIKKVSDVKSLLQYRSVSKPWKSFIDSPEFIAGYHIDHPRPRHHMLVRYNDPIHRTKTKYVSIVDAYDSDTDDNDILAQHKFPLTIPISVNQLIDPKILGSSKGLFCFFSDNAESDKNMAVMWNPSIRKSVTIDVPIVCDKSYETVLGFGVAPHSSDPKLVKIQTVVDVLDLKPRKVELYSLSTGEWRTLSVDMPRLSVEFYDEHVVIDSSIFWLARDTKYENGMPMKREMIMLFDMLGEKFMEKYLPDIITKDLEFNFLSLFKIWESLAVVRCCFWVEEVHVWMMEDGVSDSFTKMYTITTLDEGSTLLSFRNNGHLILGILDQRTGTDELSVYEPDSEQINPIGIFGYQRACYAGSYMETLLLLDH